MAVIRPRPGSEKEKKRANCLGKTAQLSLVLSKLPTRPRAFGSVAGVVITTLSHLLPDGFKMSVSQFLFDIFRFVPTAEEEDPLPYVLGNSVRELLGAVGAAVEIEQHQDVALGILSETLFVVLGEGLS